MSQFFERYKEYRLVGFTPLIAARLAWLVSQARVRAVPVRPLTRR